MPDARITFAQILVVVAIGCATIIPAATSRAADAGSKSDTVPSTQVATQPAAKVTARDIAVNAGQLKTLGEAAIAYANQHHNVLPHDLGQLLKYVPEADAAYFLTPADLKAHPAPSPLTADWINKNSSFIYLAADTPLVNDTPCASRASTIMMYAKDPFALPGGAMVNAAFMDGHVELDGVERRKREIVESLDTIQRIRPVDKEQK